MRRSVVAAGVCLLSALTVSKDPLRAQGSALVRVTPLGSHAGELCSADRAIVFEDPTGIRILYDPGRSSDDTDPRLGDVHVMLLSHVHSDHLGDARLVRGGGTCGQPQVSGQNAASNFASIAAAKRAAVVVSTEVTSFLGSKIAGVRGGAATPGCPTSGPEQETIVPTASVCTAGINPGSSTRMLTRAGAGSVRIAAVPAVHTNGVSALFLDAPSTLPAGMPVTLGSPIGYVITFSNGLRAYLTGDTGLTQEMDMIGRFYRPGLAVVNITDLFTTGPNEAAFAMQQYIRPQTVMVTHVNEVATSGGVEIAGTRTERFARLARGFTTVVPALSEVTRSFDGEGRCVGCR